MSFFEIMARKRQERFEKFVRDRQNELENFEDKEEDWDEEKTDSTEIELELQPRDIPQNLEQWKEDDERMLTESRIIHRDNSEIMLRERGEYSLKYAQASGCQRKNTPIPGDAKLDRGGLEGTTPGTDAAS